MQARELRTGCRRWGLLLVRIQAKTTEMILHRFCSNREFAAYMRGDTLTNYKSHAAARGRDVTTAVGFCFFTDDPDTAIHRLSGIVDVDICITVDVPDKAVKLCQGRYTNWTSPGIREGTVMIPEYCTISYDKTVFKLVSYTDKYRDYCPNASILRELFPGIFL